MFKTKKAPPEITRDDARKAADDYREATLKIEQIQAEVMSEQKKIASARDKELTDLAAIQKENEAKLEAFLKENQDELLSEKRSTELAGITIGFRKATAKLALTGKKNSWAEVYRQLAGNKDWSRFIKTKADIDKTELKKADKRTLKALGLTIEQPDNFFVKV